MPTADGKRSSKAWEIDEMKGLAVELRRTCRGLGRSPGFTVVAVLSLAVGIGANIAVFGAVRTLLLDTLPLPDAGELMHVAWTEPRVPLPISQVNSSGYRDPETGSSLRSNFTYEQYRALQTAGAGDASLTGYTFLREISVSIEGRPPQIAGGLLADSRYFPTLRLSTVLGRPFTEADDVPGAPAVAVIAHRFWVAAFGGDRAAVGRTIRVNGKPVEIVGVTEPAFRGLSRGGFFPETEITLPLRTQPLVAPQWSPDRGALFADDRVYWLRVLVRLDSRATVAEGPPHAAGAARLERLLTPGFRAHLPSEARGAAQPPSIRLLPGARGEPAAASGQQPLLVLFGVTAVVLLIACINIASLMLARGVVRQREIAVRRAVGASRRRLMRDLLLESAVLSAAGAAAGVLVAVWSRDALASFLTSGLGASAFGAVHLEVPIDWLFVASASGMAALAAFLCGVLPAVKLSRVDAGATLNQRAGAPLPALTVGRALSALQIAVSVPLLVGALVLLRTMSNLTAVELGFDPRGLAFVKVNPEYAGAPADAGKLFLDILQRIESVPGVVSATLIENALMTGLVSNNRVSVDGREHQMLMNAVGPRFFETVGMRIVAGRAPDAGDRRGRLEVAAVNEAAVTSIFEGRSPLGRIIRVGNRDVQIVGIVSDSRYDRPRASVQPILFDSALQRAGFGGHHVLVRVSVPIPAIENDLRRAVASVHPDLPAPSLRSQSEQIDLANARERVFAQLLTILGGFALLLAAIGLHGITSYTVVRRTSEIGIRVAVGATPARVVWLVTRHIGFVLLAGLAVGIPAALALGPLIDALLYGVVSSDAYLVAGAAALLAAAAGAAAMRPAIRAARLDVAAAMKAE